MLMDDTNLMDRCDFSIIIGLDNANTFDSGSITSSWSAKSVSSRSRAGHR